MITSKIKSVTIKGRKFDVSDNPRLASELLLVADSVEMDPVKDERYRFTTIDFSGIKPIDIDMRASNRMESHTKAYDKTYSNKELIKALEEHEKELESHRPYMIMGPGFREQVDIAMREYAKSKDVVILKSRGSGRIMASKILKRELEKQKSEKLNSKVEWFENKPDLNSEIFDLGRKLVTIPSDIDIRKECLIKVLKSYGEI